MKYRILKREAAEGQTFYYPQHINWLGVFKNYKDHTGNIRRYDNELGAREFFELEAINEKMKRTSHIEVVDLMQA